MGLLKSATERYNRLPLAERPVAQRRDQGGCRLAIQVSVIVTVRNEKDTIAQLLESLCEQTRPADEVVIVDGGSTDDTLAQLRAWEDSGRLPLRVLVEPGCNISRGRNLAIAVAHGPIIASTDAGVRLEPSWLAGLLQTFSSDLAAQTAPVVACGFFVPQTHSTFETAMAATVLPVLADVCPDRFLPSSRSVAFWKSSWEAVGGYPEWLDYCEDLIFDFRLKARGERFVFVPTARVHFRPRSSLPAFFWQYYRYARGDGRADLWRKRHAARYLTYVIALPVLICLIVSKSLWWGLVLAAGMAVMFWTPYRRLIPMLQPFGNIERLKA
ncbi:MAG: glycosyltransferase, partial [Chloroflexi bacterium]|nr:glycosyltransferase [Chloroflexota bacterium]